MDGAAKDAGVRDEGAEAWRVSPDQYLRDHPPRYRGCRLSSRYVAVRDGTRIALDIHLPEGAETDAAFPAIVLFTPYYRRFSLAPGHREDLEASPNTAQFRDAFVPQGYAVVVADVRGCGASFGARDGFRSPRERLDTYDVVDWIVGQPWSDGTVGSTGISYVGAAADFLASTGHPAVKAVIPSFSVWDTWSNHLWPGGMLCRVVAENYGDLALALDRDRREALANYAIYADPGYAGPAPVDEDPDGALLEQAIAEHGGTIELSDFMAQLEFRDSGLAHDPAYGSAAISPYHYAERGNDARTAVYGVSGWMDGAGYTSGAIQRYLWQRNPKRRLTIGPWDHGARGNVSPWRREPVPRFNLLAEYLRFFDAHLKGRDNGLDREKPVHYFTMGEEAWKAAEAWPIAAEARDFYFAAEGGLGREAPAGAGGADAYRADHGCGSGHNSRYERLYVRIVETYYRDWHGRDQRMLTYSGAPLAQDTEVTGHPVARLHLASSEPDCGIFVYLEDVDPAGTCRYVTEGLFRARHRKPGAPPAAIPATGPSHSFKRADAAPLTPGEPFELAFELLPTSYLFRKGHRIRVAIAAADRDHFAPIPEGRPPLLTLYRDRERPSRVTLPIVPRGG
jgi:putative CocE/NonD family hydrolase